MPLYYLVACPETVLPWVRPGHLPEVTRSSLPAPLRHVCYRNKNDCLANTSVTNDYKFIVELNLPTQRDSSRFMYAGDAEDPNDFVVLRDFEPSWVVRVSGHTEHGRVLLNRLLSASSLPTDSLWARRSAPRHQIEVIATRDQHVNLLRSAFSEARRKILLTTRGMRNDLFRMANLYELIAGARRRNIEIYIYYSDYGSIDNGLRDFLVSQGVHLDVTLTHSKILAVDNTFISIGSFNWLEASTQFEAGEEGSFVYRGPSCHDLVEESWQHIRHYRNIQFNNLRQIRNFANSQINHEVLTQDIGGSELSYLATLEQHRAFIQNCFRTARECIVICSPFVNHQFKSDISIAMVIEAAHRGVEVCFLYQPNPAHHQILQNFLRPILSSGRVHLVPVQNFHSKTIVIDSNIISQGSFNWLSATRDPDSPFHSHETTLIIEGERANALIDHFYQTRVGRTLQNALPGPRHDLAVAYS